MAFRMIIKDREHATPQIFEDMLEKRGVGVYKVGSVGLDLDGPTPGEESGEVRTSLESVEGGNEVFLADLEFNMRFIYGVGL